MRQRSALLQSNPVTGKALGPKLVTLAQNPRSLRRLCPPIYRTGDRAVRIVNAAQHAGARPRAMRAANPGVIGLVVMAMIAARPALKKITRDPQCQDSQQGYETFLGAVPPRAQIER